MRIVSVLILAGGLLVLLLSTISYQAPGSSIAPPAAVVARLDGATPLVQRLPIATLGLSSLRIAAQLPAGAEALTVTMQLRLADSGLPDLAVATTSVNSDGTGLEFRFPPLPTRLAPWAVTSTLELILAAPDLPAGAGLELLGGLPQEDQATLLIGEQARDGLALSVQPLYQRRPLDSLVPISMIAAGRPGIFGWSPLYPLLAYSYLVLLGYGVAAIMRRLRSMGT